MLAEVGLEVEFVVVAEINLEGVVDVGVEGVVGVVVIVEVIVEVRF